MEDRYNPDGAEKRYRENLAAKGAPLKIGNDHELADYLERKVIEEDRSPAAALADINDRGPDVQNLYLCQHFLRLH